MKTTNQKGFGTAEVVITIVVIGLIAVVGWLVLGANSVQKSDTGTSKSTKSTTSKTTETKKTVGPTDGWLEYASVSGKYSFKYPPTWLVADHLDACGEGTVLLAPAKASLGVCGSEFGGQVHLSSSPGDVREDLGIEIDPMYHKDITEGYATIDGVKAERNGATTIGLDNQFVGSVPDGTKIVSYVVYTNGRTYYFGYEQEPSWPDALSDFDTLVTKTLKFTK